MADPKVCVSLEGTTVKQMADEAARANLAGADFVEVRFDRLFIKQPEPDAVEDENGEVKHVMPPESEWPVRDMESIDVEECIQSLKESIPLPVIFTVRPLDEGGHYPGEEDGRIAILEKAICFTGVNSIDLELSIGDKARSTLVEQATSAKVNIISSIHNTTTTPSAEELVNMVNEHAKDGEIFKFCGTVNDHQDALQIVEASHELKTTSHAYSMMASATVATGLASRTGLGQSLVYARCGQVQVVQQRPVNIRDLKNAWALMEY